MFGKVLSFVLLLGLVLADSSEEDRSGGQSGGQSGNHNCVIVDATVTSCAGATGPSCSNSSALLGLVQGGATTALVCKGNFVAPRSVPITLKTGFGDCRRCTCFLAPIAETRLCSELNADPTFVKDSCKNQAALAALVADPANAGTTRICVLNRAGDVIQSATVTIYASLDN